MQINDKKIRILSLSLQISYRDQDSKDWRQIVTSIRCVRVVYSPGRKINKNRARTRSSLSRASHTFPRRKANRRNNLATHIERGNFTRRKHDSQLTTTAFGFVTANGPAWRLFRRAGNFAEQFPFLTNAFHHGYGSSTRFLLYSSRFD